MLYLNYRSSTTSMQHTQSHQHQHSLQHQHAHAHQHTHAPLHPAHWLRTLLPLLWGKGDTWVYSLVVLVVLGVSVPFLLPSNASAASAQATLAFSPAGGKHHVGTPFTTTLLITSSPVFNTVGATVTTSPNLTLQSITPGTCGLGYVQSPTLKNPSFAGAIFGGSASNCSIYLLTLLPTSGGSGSITLTQATVIGLSGLTLPVTLKSAAYTLRGQALTPTPIATAATTTTTAPVCHSFLSCLLYRLFHW